MLTIGGGSIRGEGSDPQGSFILEGVYDAGGEVRLTKIYTVWNDDPYSEPLLVERKGKWNGEFIHGRWQVVPESGESGVFEMWPESEELDLTALSIEQTDAMKA